MSKTYPAVGNWYKTFEGEILKVVALDQDEQSVEIQFYDGTVEEYDTDTWGELVQSAAEPPEDWAGSLDLENEDYGIDLDRPAGESHDNPMDNLDKEE